MQNIFDQNYYQCERERILCRVSGFVFMKQTTEVKGAESVLVVLHLSPALLFTDLLYLIKGIDDQRIDIIITDLNPCLLHDGRGDMRYKDASPGQ